MKLLFLTLLFLALVPFSAKAQTPSEACATNHNAPPVSAYYWPPDTEVKVYFARDKFTADQHQILFEALGIWTNAAKSAGAGVRFTYEGETSELVSCPGCLTVTRRDVYRNDRKHYAFFSPLKQDEEGLLISAWIDFDFATTNPRALRGFMVHELGHGMGLWDCATCKKKQTIMSAFPGINRNNGLVAPSACDLEVVRQVYALQRRQTRNVPDAVSSNK